MDKKRQDWLIDVATRVHNGQADLTWAVLHMLDNEKLRKVQEEKDLLAFFMNMAPEDPFELIELPAVGGRIQYLVKDKEVTLPFMEDGITEKHKNDLATSGLLREQLAIYKKEYPEMADFIDAELKKADASDCTSCDEKKILTKVARMAKERENDAEVTNIPAEETTSARPPCADCTRKHISQAIILINESHQGYPAHRWLAIGHLAEAADESIGKWPSVAFELREERLKLMEDPMYIPDLMQFLEMDYDD